MPDVISYSAFWYHANPGRMPCQDVMCLTQPAPVYFHHQVYHLSAACTATMLMSTFTAVYVNSRSQSKSMVVVCMLCSSLQRQGLPSCTRQRPNPS